MDDKEPILISNRIFTDERGEFVKLFNAEEIAGFNIVQTNCVRNQTKGTFRGFHMQSKPFSESKIFMVLNGNIQLVCFNYSDTIFPKKVFSFNLEGGAATSVRVPKGFATGYLVQEDDTTVLYFSDEKYDPEREIGVNWNDPSLEKFLDGEPDFISKKDTSWPNLTS